MTKKRIIVVGGGAGGLELVTRLGKKLGRRNKANITLIDCSHNHLWKPLLHEIATGALDDSVDALNYHVHAANHSFDFQFGRLIAINRDKKKIHLDKICDEQGQILVEERELEYDILVLAIGSGSNDFNTPGVKEHAIFLDSASQAQFLHNQLLNRFLAYSLQPHMSKPINISIIGAGATGVELSAELYNTVHLLHRYGYREINRQALQVTLIEAGERILPALPARISTAAHQELEKLGVKVRTQLPIVQVFAEGLQAKSGEFIEADLIVWAAGIKAPDFMKNIAGLETNHLNQLIVSETLQTTQDKAIFALGDCAQCLQADGRPVPPRAQAAHQMADCCYRNIYALLKGEGLKPFVYKDRGSLISLSRFSTIGNLIAGFTPGTITIEGRLARLMYLSLYRMHQIALHGYIKTGLIMLVSGINKAIRPRLKLH